MNSLIITTAITFLTNIVLPILLAFIADRILRKYIRVPSHITSPRAITYLAAVKDGVSIVIFLFTVYYILSHFGVNLTPFFASAGVIGIIVGFGFRPILEDFFIATFIFTQDTFRIGDYVVIGDSEGWVEYISFRTIKLRDKSGAIHIFPNHEVKKIVNYSRRDVEVKIDIPVKYSKNIDDILDCFTKTLDEMRALPDMDKHISKHSSIAGIEDINDSGKIIVRTILITKIINRATISRRFRYMILKEMEKRKLNIMK